MGFLGRRSPYFVRLREEIARLGGMFNAHLHLDRAGTLDDRYLDVAKVKVLENSHISLQKKHHLINAIHAGPAYQADDLSSTRRSTSWSLPIRGAPTRWWTSRMTASASRR
jgi:hypothetical protein